ncbi:MAG: photosynthetic complex putative assembly protein PuhB [Roseiarcus sp.]|jgi:PH (Pleckstrin Homology) domain-containing protein
MKAVNLELLLPADIPHGERILWHGRPQWISLARRAFRADYVAAYFGAVAAINFIIAGYSGGLAEAGLSATKTLAAGAAALSLLFLLAYLASRTSLYVVTSRRVIMKIGIALPIFLNLPFSSIAAAALHAYPDGTGEIPLALAGGTHIAYLHLWPHARPFRLARPEPALRSVRNAAAVAETLGRALVAAAEETRAAGDRPVAGAEAYPDAAVAAA